jgi:hypothetical protein
MKRDLIFKEIDVVQAQIARYDEQGLKIKGLCVTLSAALVALGINNNLATAHLIAFVVIVLFSALEWAYRIVQARFIVRSKEIEDILKSECLDSYQYSVNRTAKGEFDTKHTIWRIAFSQKQFLIFYGGMATLTIGMFIYTYYELALITIVNTP